MDKFLKDSLIAHGLDPNATDQEAQTFYASLSAEQKAEVDGTKAQLAAGGSTGTVALNKPTVTRTVIDPEDALVQLQEKRVTRVRQLAKTLGFGDDDGFVKLQIASGKPIADVQKEFLQELQKRTPAVNLAPGSSIGVGEDRKIKMLSTALPDAIVQRAGHNTFYEVDARRRVVRNADGTAKRAQAHEEAAKYSGLSILDTYRQWLIGFGADKDDVYMLSRTELADLLGPRALRRRFPQVAQLAQSSSDFGNVLQDAQNKMLRIGYVESARTWQLWAKRGTAPDFKNINRPQISEVGSLKRRNQGGPIQYVTLTDSKESYALQEYIGGVKLTRQTLINDDLNVFADVPMKQGQAAARLEDDTAYYIPIKNANLADGGALFNVTVVTTAGGHANRVAGGAPTVANVSVTEKLMMLQRGPKNQAILNITPKFWLGPVALKTTAEQFFASRVDPSKNNDTPNPYNGRITPISNARFDLGYLNDDGTTDVAGSALIWFLFADYRDGNIDTIEVCFLADEPEPVLKQETDFDTDDQKYAIRHVVAAKALDFRGVAMNNGA
jgi:hypothetical protein